MPLEKEEKYMETKIARISREEEKTVLLLDLGDEELGIVLTDDNPNNIKDSFNKIILKLKKELFQFQLEDEKSDLYHHICEEYLAQLNSEIKVIHQEMSEYDLLTGEGE